MAGLDLLKGNSDSDSCSVTFDGNPRLRCLQDFAIPSIRIFTESLLEATEGIK